MNATLLKEVLVVVLPFGAKTASDDKKNPTLAYFSLVQEKKTKFVKQKLYSLS